MHRLTRATTAILSALALGTMGTVAPAAASAVPLDRTDGSLTCTYSINTKANKVSGSCSGTTSVGAASGSFSGHVRPNGLASGSITLHTPLGSLEGEFRGKPFKPAPPTKAKGEWSVSAGKTALSGTLKATIR
ncbi:hypothetical protein [Haloechinothrix sp. LS1_15]|uniref:hypothetical protein n=1 Tax=Haloechinothrix sp. LS1_15 TaxID=2652248 RepID=UPI00294618E3|nr:hypothetical protein [Haloechinothrix sp. LS1_15]MDV6012356.1 hypothetical protein [Haloechinothrix sp. LS1_15]